MASNNPSITASDIITDVEARLGSPNISTTIYLPWVSYAYQQLHLALENTSQRTKETLFGYRGNFDLTAGVSEYSISTYLPRLSSIIKVELKYGGTGDDWVKLSKLPSLSQWDNQNNVSTSYRAKNEALYYLLGDLIGFIPTPPTTDTGTPTVRVWHVRRGYQLTDGADVIDIPYRFIFPVVNFVQAKAIQKNNEDYGQSAILERTFHQEVELAATMADGEFNENTGEFVQDSNLSDFNNNPLR